MVDYTKELILHIQGLDFYIGHYFQEADSTDSIEILPGNEIQQINVTKLGGYIPRLVRFIYLDVHKVEKQQSYMVKYVEGNLLCTPTLNESDIIHPFSQETSLPNKVTGIVLSIPPSYINSEGWVSVYQEGIPWWSGTYTSFSQPNETYLQF